MKDKLIIFIIGVLVGAVIATGSFYIYLTTSNCSNNNQTQMNGGQPPEMPSGENGQQAPNNTQENSTQNNS